MQVRPASIRGMEYLLIGILFVLLIATNSRITKLEDRLRSGKVAVAPPPVVASVKPPAPVITPDFDAPAPPREKHQTEFKFGSEWLTGAGALAVLIGVGFFFRYAFEQNLISEPMRVVIGLIAGALFLGAGWWLRTKYRAFGLTVAGLGLGTIYISFYAAYALYGLIGPFLGFALLIGAVLLGILMSLLFDAKQLAAVSLVGGYVSILLYIAHLNALAIFASLILLSVLVIAVSYKKKWPELVTLALVSSSLGILGWDGLAQYPEMIALPILSLLYAIFVVSTMFNFARTTDTYTTWQSFNLYATPVLFLLVAGFRLFEEREPVGLVALGIAFFYALISLGVRAYAGTHVALRKFTEVTLLVVPAFIALAISIYFDGNAAIALLSIEGALVVVSSLVFGNRAQFILGQLTLAAGVLLLPFYAFNIPDSAPFLFNEYTLTTLASAIALSASWFAAVRIKSKLAADEVAGFRKIDALASLLIMVVLVFAEVWRLLPGSDYYMPVALFVISLLGLKAFLGGFMTREAVLRYAGYGILVLGAALLAMSALIGRHELVLWNPYVLALISLLTLAAVAYSALRREAEYANEYQEVRRFILAAGNAAALVVLTMEVHHGLTLLFGGEALGYMQQIGVSIFWLLYAIVGLMVGIGAKSTFVRQMAVMLFAVATLKVFLIDSQQLTDFFRFISFIALGIVLLVAGFLYYRFKDRIKSFVGIEGRNGEGA